MIRIGLLLLLIPLTGCALSPDEGLNSRIASTCVVAGWTPGTDEHSECMVYVASANSALSSTTLQTRAEEFSRRYLARARARYSGLEPCCATASSSG